MDLKHALIRLQNIFQFFHLGSNPAIFNHDILLEKNVTLISDEMGKHCTRATVFPNAFIKHVQYMTSQLIKDSIKGLPYPLVA